MPLICISDPTVADTEFTEVDQSFRILYRELWERRQSDEISARRNIFVQKHILFPDYEDLQDTMESNDMDVDMSSGASVEPDDNEVAVSDPVCNVPDLAFDYTLLDLSWLPASIANSRNVFLVRPEYTEAMAAFEQDQKSVVLLGHPSVGKTLFLKYALVERLLKRSPTIYMTTSNKFYLFRESGAYQFTRAEMGHRMLFGALREIHHGNVPGGDISSRDKGWILFDSDEAQKSPDWSRMGFRGWKVVLASTPQPSRYKEWAKQIGADKYMMKPWSWPEICAAAPLQTCIRPVNQLWDAYNRFGSSARIVYDADPVAHEEVIRRALKQCQDPDLLFPLSDYEWDNSISKVLVVVGPATLYGQMNRNILPGRIATRYIMNMVHKEAPHLLGFSMLETYRDLLRGHSRDVTTGLIFEERVHRLLGTPSYGYRIRHLPSDDGPSSPISYDLSTHDTVIFENLAQISDNLQAYTYYRPLQMDFPGIDSFALINGRLVLFQISTTRDHPVKLRGFNRLVGSLPAVQWDRCLLIFVVPADMEPEFRRQPFAGLSPRSTWMERLDQYVLGFTPAELFPTARVNEVV